MATSFKDLSQDDKTVTRTMLHESIPITGTLLSGTYAVQGNDPEREANIKVFEHGMFQAVYDYPYASSSANHIFDLTCGFSTAVGGSSQSGSATVQVAKKVNIYNQMAQILVGYDTGSHIRRFDADGDLTGGVEHDNALFINFARLLTKDEIKKGSFAATLGVADAYATPFTLEREITDSAAAQNYKINSPAGEYGILKTTSTAGVATITISTQANVVSGDSIAFQTTDGTSVTASVGSSTSNTDTNTPSFVSETNENTTATNLASCLNANSKITATAEANVVTITQATVGNLSNATVTLSDSSGGTGMSKTDFSGDHTSENVGLIYYQAGIAVLTSSIFPITANMDASSTKMNVMLKDKTIDEISDSVRHRVKNISFNNTTELNSSIYFCRANAHEFNYSSNPTYIDSNSKIRVKSTGTTRESENSPISYITTVGLYSFDNELLAVAKLSEPLKKTNSSDLTLRVRLDY